MSLDLSRYFTLALLAFLASFLLLPSSKAVNNVFYLFLALPALVALFLGKAPKPRATLLTICWGLLFAWLALSRVGDGLQYLKYLLYITVFCAVIWLWVDWHVLEKTRLQYGFLWSILLYVVGSALFFWVTGSKEPGERILVLPSRMQGPILTSMLIASCFALLLPHWLDQRRWLEIALTTLVALFCIGFVLQSRTGLVGLGALLAVVLASLVAQGSLWLRAGSILALVLLAMGCYWLFQHSEVAAGLVTRADAGRFELWIQYLEEWRQCGLLLGCGPGLEPDIRILGGAPAYHPHNILLSMGFRSGLPGALLFSAAMLATLWQAWQQRNPWGGYLLIALLMLNFDGRELVNSPHEVWLLVLLPSMLIAARQRTMLSGQPE